MTSDEKSIIHSLLSRIAEEVKHSRPLYPDSQPVLDEINRMVEQAIETVNRMPESSD